MRGRRGPCSSLVTQQQARMALRKEPVKDCVPSEYQQTQENTQEDDAVDNKEELSLSLLPPAALSRDKRRRERENKPKSKEMTEEEMMDLALRLSEHEASVTASRLKQEEEAMMKAIKESMVSQTQTFPPSQSLLADDHADVSLQLCSRRKLFHSHGKMTSGSNRGNYCLTETGEAKTTGEQNNNCNKKQKGKEGFLPAMPDQTQEVYSRASPCSSESVSVPLDSPQSSDSTQIDDCQLRKSPVFPLTGCRATVCISRLSQELLQTCKTSGFVSCSQDIWTQKSPIVQAKSPTFPKSPMNFPACPNSPAFTDTYQGQDGEQAMSPERGESPVFGRTTQHEQPQSACKPQVCKNSGFMFFSQESLSSTGRSASCRPKSPVFPGSRGIPNSLPETSGISKSPVFSGTERGPAGPSRGCSAGTVQRTTVDPDMMNSFAVPSSSEPRGSPAIVATSQSLEEDAKTDHSQDDGFKKLSQSMTDDAQVNEASKDCSSADAELTSDMTLLWSDEDDNDVTPTGSPSPVFPEERPAHQASLNHVTAADPETTGANCSSQKTTKRASTPCEESAAGPMVHYYWGVPFCPRGLDPDKYTQVILAQMEVYEKSLKQAQRCLLRKAEWGEPVLPQPENSPSRESPAESPQPHNPQRHCLRLRRKKLRGSADVSPGEEVDEKNTENKEEEENNGGGEDNTDDCEVCPGTQLSDVYNDSSQDLTVVPDGDAQTQPESRELPEAEMIVRGHSPTAGRQQMEEEMEVDAPVCRETQGSFPACRDVGNGTLEEEMMDPDVEEVTEQKCRRSASPELEAAGPPQSPEAKIDCPICQGSFPATEIEVHAAYCDGEVAIVDERRAEIISLPNTLKPRRKRTRRAEVTDEEMDSRSTAGRDHEKCYVCQKAVPLRDYSHHTEFCIQHPTAKPKAKGNLLSALEQSESRDSDAGPSKLHPGEVIDLRDDEDENDSVSAFRISNSPIRSFTPISEATDCLVDFRKHQRSKKPSRRQR